jgi:hypothetical protein
MELVQFDIAILRRYINSKITLYLRMQFRRYLIKCSDFCLKFKSAINLVFQGCLSNLLRFVK